MYVLRRSEDGKFVAKPGNIHSYTQFLQCAQVFPTKDAAEDHACGNEYPVPVENCFHG
jgi:hypothetical protein